VWSWRYTDDPADLIGDQATDQPVEDIAAGHSIDQESTDRPPADGNLVDIEVPQREVLEEIGSRHSVPPSTWSLTDVACPHRASAAQVPTNYKILRVTRSPTSSQLRPLALIGQGEKVVGLLDFINLAVPGALEPNEMHAVESMLERNTHWRKIMWWLGKERGYDWQYTQALIDRAARSNWDLPGTFDFDRDEVLAR
jgi:hypothetical protein